MNNQKEMKTTSLVFETSMLERLDVLCARIKLDSGFNFSRGKVIRFLLELAIRDLEEVQKLDKGFVEAWLRAAHTP